MPDAAQPVQAQDAVQRPERCQARAPQAWARQDQESSVRLASAGLRQEQRLDSWPLEQQALLQAWLPSVLRQEQARVSQASLRQERPSEEQEWP